MPGKIAENILVQHAVDAVDETTAVTRYNSQATTTNGVGIDSRGYDEVMAVLNTGLFGGDGTLDVTILHGDADDWSAAAAISGAAFTQVDTDNDQSTHNANITQQTTSLKRYLWMKTVKAGTGSASYAGDFILSKSQSRRTKPESNSLVFDL